MNEHDCNSCRHHKQGQHPPLACRACLSYAGLPLWEPKEELVETIEITDVSPHAIVSDYMPMNAVLHTPAHKHVGIGGAPTRATTLPDDPKERKKYPVASGVLDYFPDAIAAISRLSYAGNEQHNPGQPLHWARGKSTDEADTMLRHFLQRGTWDTDGMRHSAKMAWRALALLQKEIEAEAK